MARLLVYSDLHLEFGPLPRPTVQADVAVLAGDIWTKCRGVPWKSAREFFGCTTLLVPGNHEFYGDKIDTGLDKLHEAGAEQDLMVLENEQVIEAGVRFLGATLWSDFKLNAGNDLDAIKRDANFCVGSRYGGRLEDYWSIRVAKGGYRKFRPKDAAERFYASVAWLKERLSEPFDGPTVVVSHHAPSKRSIPPQFINDRRSCAYASHLDEMIEEFQPEVWIHGHIHEAVDPYQIGRTRIVSNPRGYVPDDLNPKFDPNLIIEV
jgi:hypothetical protein